MTAGAVSSYLIGMRTRSCLFVLFLLTLVSCLGACGPVLPGPSGAVAPVVAPPVMAPGKFAPNYAGGPEMKELLQWRRFPLRVFVAPNGTAYTPDRERAARAGFDQWVRGTNGVLGYRLVNTPAQADVTVRFIANDYVKDGVPDEPGVVGRTEITEQRVRGRRRLVRANMVLAVGKTTRGDLVEVAAHEWGHALGINGHSDYPDDLMYGVTMRYVRADGSYLPRRFRSVTERDLNTIRTSYGRLFREVARSAPPARR